MKFGFGLITCQRYPDDRRTDLELYRDALDLVQKAERLGFDSAWVTEHHFWDDAYMPSLLVFCGAAGAVTQQITIGTAVLLAPLYDPLRLAEDAATVDLLCSGRFTLGLGQGWMRHEFEALRVPLSGRHIRFEQAVAKLRAAWSGELVAEESDHRGVLVTPEPAQRGGPPIWLGAQHEQAIRRAARIGEGFISASAFTPALLAQQVAIIRDEAARVERDLDGFVFSLHRPTFAWPGPDAWAHVREHAYYVSWKYEDMAQPRRSRDGARMPPPLNLEREAAILGGMGLVGRPTEIVEQLLALQAVTPGELHYIARLYWPGMDPGVQREAMEIFAEDVIANVRAELGSPTASAEMGS
jgi:alkanesulfonate monooxygenase SsuD/methylene tetrahydromethanopterin reductase-like flavin-dependent oxidoreductase (luciferase family)